MHDALSRLAHTFRVSTLVILRHLLDAGWLTRENFDIIWEQESERLRKLGPESNIGGGNSHLTTVMRVRRRFTHALVVSTLEGQTLYRDAFRMLGIQKTETFNNLVRKGGMMNGNESLPGSG